MSLATPTAPAVLALTLTQLARKATAQMTGVSYRDADTGHWCPPAAPATGCVCPPGEVGCDACWTAYLHHVAT